MSEEDLDLDFNDNDDTEKELANTKNQVDERKRFVREQIELRKMAKELGLSLDEYLEAFGN